MEINEVTVEQLKRVADADSGVSAADAKQLEYKLRQTPFSIPMQRYEAASDTLGALAFGIEIGLRLARQD